MWLSNFFFGPSTEWSSWKHTEHVDGIAEVHMHVLCMHSAGGAHHDVFVSWLRVMINQSSVPL